MAQLIIFDMEWNMGYQPKTFRYKDTEQTLRGEIIQIGAVKMEGQEIRDTFRVTLKPRIFRKLHHHVAKVTGLTQEEINRGLPIAEGLEKFRDWCGPDAALGEWGLDDVPVLKQNLVLNGLDESWPRCWYDMQRVYTSQKPRGEGESMMLENVVERLGIPKDEAFHDALADAVYTAKVCQFIDIAKGLADYPDEAGMLHELLCPKDRVRQDFKSWAGYVDGESWLTDPELRGAVCLECKKPLELDADNVWLRRGNNCMYSMGVCPQHGQQLIWLRRSRSDGLHYTFARAVETANVELSAKWKKEKKAALERTRRKREREAAEAMLRVKNAGR